MTETSRAWMPLDNATDISVPAKPAQALWTPVLNYVTGPVILRLSAFGLWQPSDALPSCSPDGLLHWAFAREGLLTKKAPLGALIAKIGGSSSGIDDSGDLFLIGSRSVLTIDKAVGPLYLTINDAPWAFHDNAGEVKVTIELAI